jgi:DNA-binding CsgD family transcriptional regulator
LLRSEWYDYCQKVDWFHCLGIGVSIGKDLVGGIGFHRPRFERPYDEADRRKAQFILPHLERALQIQHRIAMVTQERDIALDVLDNLSIGILFVTSDARVLFANRFAERALQSADALSASRGCLRIQDSKLRHHFERLVGEAVQTSGGRGTKAGGVIAVATASGRKLSLLISPFRSISIGYGLPLPAAVIIFADPQVETVLPDKVLEALFGFTPAQTRLVLALLAGQGLAEYARSAGISINTAKTQMRQVFAKTGYDRQVDLVRAISANPIVKLAQPRDR